MAQKPCLDAIKIDTPSLNRVAFPVSDMGQWQRNGSLLGKTSADCQEIPSLSERLALFGGAQSL